MSLIRRIMTLGRSRMRINRTIKITDALIRYNLTDITDKLPNSSWSSRKSEKHHRAKDGNTDVKQETLQLTKPVRLRLMMQELGPTFVKLGQVLATRPDLIPLEYTEEFAKLQDKVPPVEFEKIKPVIEAELKRPISECFDNFEEEPFAAASVGQAHRANLKDGTPVIVKVQRPNILMKVTLDLEILRGLSVFLEKHDEAIRLFGATALVDEFSYVLLRELDYTIEAGNAQRFARDMAQQEGIYAMKVFDEFTSKRVLTMERIDGVSGSQLVRQPELRPNYDLPRVAANGAKAILSQIFDHGFFHADPHPGNLILRDDGLITFIDFGMMGKISEEARNDFVRALFHMFQNDYAGMVRYILKLTVQRGDPPNMAKLERSASDIVEDNLFQSLEKMSFAAILNSVMTLLNEHHLALKPEVFVMVKSLMTIESLGRVLDPKMQLIDLVRPVIQKQMLKSFDPRPTLLHGAENISTAISSTISLPGLLRDIAAKMSEGQLPIKLEIPNVEQLGSRLLMGTLLLSLSVLMAGMLVASAVLVNYNDDKVTGGDIVGQFGFFFAVAFGVILIINMIRCRRNM